MKRRSSAVAIRERPDFKEQERIEIETILVAIDFSEFSSKALQYALALAGKFRARLLLVSVLQTQVPAYELDAFMTRKVLEWNEQMERRRKEMLATLAAESIGSSAKYTCFARRGDPTGELLAVAAEEHADLIVMATHGRTGLKHLLLGSVAEKTVRLSSCPVLVVRSRQPEFIDSTVNPARLELQQIVVPTDFSDGSSQALAWAEAVAEETGARLDLLNVVPHHQPVNEYDALVFPKVEAEMLESGKTRLATIVRSEQNRGLESQSTVVIGLPRSAIIDYAAEHKSDMVIMGTRGVSGIKHLLLGSTAEYVVRHAPCAVLTVPYPKAGANKSNKIAEAHPTNV